MLATYVIHFSVIMFIVTHCILMCMYSTFKDISVDMLHNAECNDSVMVMPACV